MNALLQNPFVHDTPDNVERVLRYAQASCIRYNRGSGVGGAAGLLFAGSYLAAGRGDGIVTIWDPHTAGILRWLEGHAGRVTSVAWSRCNRFLASGSMDHSVIVWDLLHESTEVLHVVRFDGPVESVEFDPINSSVLLVVLSASQDAVLVNMQDRFRVQRTRTIQRSTDNSDQVGPWGEPSIIPLPPRRWRLIGQSAEPSSKIQSLASACFVFVSPASTSSTVGSAPPNEAGVYIFAGTQKGGLAVYDAHARTLVQFEPSVLGTSAVRQLTYHAGYGLLVANCNDRKIRVCDVHLAPPGASGPTSKGSKVFEITAKYQFQDQIGRTRWNGIGLSADGEYIYAGAVNAEKHSVYIWERVSGTLNKTIEGPKDPLADVDWHPARPAMATLGVNGGVNLWSVPSEENWSAYAPGFEELEENTEYEEREGEFDVEDEDEANQRQRDEEVALVDIFPPGQAAQTADSLYSLAHPPAVDNTFGSDPFWIGTGYVHLPQVLQMGDTVVRERPVEQGGVEQTWIRVVGLGDPDSDATFRIVPVLENEPIELQSDSSD